MSYNPEFNYTNFDEPVFEGGSVDVVGFVSRHWLKGVLIAIVVALLIVMIVGLASEHMDGVYYLNQMTMSHPDPTGFKYTGRRRDILGESGRDYYLQNLTYANSGVAPQLLEGDLAFKNQTDYLDMPRTCSSAY